MNFRFDIQRFDNSSWSGYTPSPWELQLQAIQAHTAGQMYPWISALNSTAGNLFANAVPQLQNAMNAYPELFNQANAIQGNALTAMANLTTENKNNAIAANSNLNDLSRYYGTLGESMYNKAEPLSHSPG